MHFKIISAFFLLTLFSICQLTSAAQLLELRNHPNTILQTFIPEKAIDTSATVKETSRFIDFNRVTHVRVQEYYRGYPVWNGHAIIHFPHFNSSNRSFIDLFKAPSPRSMNGELYLSLNKDLEAAPKAIFTKEQSLRALDFVVKKYKEQTPYQSHLKINNSKTALMIFVDEHQIAHWVYKISFNVPADKLSHLPSRPVYLIDAVNFVIYQNWNDIKTEFVDGGGFGGNPLIGKLIYDGELHQLASFIVKRENNECYFDTNEILVKNANTDETMHYPCLEKDKKYNQVYWNGNFDEINGGYSPTNDAMFAAQVLKQFYKSWYNVPILENDGKEMQLVMKVHAPKMDNAFWDGESMTFGDGTALYPLTSLNVAAHEVSHGFTEHHSNLTYVGQSGGMNEAFSDMAAQTAEYYSFGKSSWLVGNNVIKLVGETLRYVDEPIKDCYGKEPGTFCSIDSAREYYDGLDVHFSSGVYNRAFYLLSSTPSWNPRKAFAVMLHANTSYWHPETNYIDGAACAIKAAQDLGYDANAVKLAFQAVDISVNQSCTNKDN